jgi:hypothetical protein
MDAKRKIKSLAESSAENYIAYCQTMRVSMLQTEGWAHHFHIVFGMYAVHFFGCGAGGHLVHQLEKLFHFAGWL